MAQTSLASNQETLTNKLNAIYDQFRTLCFGKAGVAIATTKTDVKTVNAVDFAIDSVMYSKAAADNFWDLTGFNVADGKAAHCLLCVDSAGAASIVAGTEADTAAAAVVPDAPNDKAVFGRVLIEMSGASFTGGTTLLDAAGVTATYFDHAFHFKVARG